MRLNPRAQEDRMIQATRRFERIEQHFTEFKATLEWFKDPRCPLKQVNIEPSDDPRCVYVSFGSTKIALRLLLVLPEDGAAAGQVICTRVQPKFGAIDPMFASFTFDARGYTSFEPDSDGDPIEMAPHAVEIVLYVLEIAARPIEAINGSLDKPAGD